MALYDLTKQPRWMKCSTAKSNCIFFFKTRITRILLIFSSVFSLFFLTIVLKKASVSRHPMQTTPFHVPRAFFLSFPPSFSPFHPLNSSSGSPLLTSFTAGLHTEQQFPTNPCAVSRSWMLGS